MTGQSSNWASALQAPTSYAAAPAAPSAAPLAQPSMLAQLGMYVNKAAQYMGKYPTTFQLSYKSSDTERWTYATIGAGSINIRDQAKQAGLIKAGVTGMLTSLNRDLTKTHSETTVKVEAVNVFVSTQSLITLKDLTSKIAAYLIVAIEEGKIPTPAEVNKKQILDLLKTVGFDLGVPRRRLICVLDGPAERIPAQPALYASLRLRKSSKECYIRFKGVDALALGVPESEIRAFARQEADKAMWSAVSLINQINAAPDEETRDMLGVRLTQQMEFFTLCASDEQWKTILAYRSRKSAESPMRCLCPLLQSR